MYIPVLCFLKTTICKRRFLIIMTYLWAEILPDAACILKTPAKHQYGEAAKTGLRQEVLPAYRSSIIGL
jgi:hypothetical protein